MSRGNKKIAICKKRSLGRNPPFDTLSWILALPDNTFLLFKPPHPWCLVLAALANQGKKAALYLFIYFLCLPLILHLLSVCNFPSDVL